MLTTAQLKDRLHALRLLKGLDQREFTRLCAEQGLGSTEAGRVERGKVPFTGKHQLVFARVLDVPEVWLTDPDISRLLWAAESEQAAATRFGARARRAAQQQDEHPLEGTASRSGPGVEGASNGRPDHRHLRPVPRTPSTRGRPGR